MSTPAASGGGLLSEQSGGGGEDGGGKQNAENNTIIITPTNSNSKVISGNAITIATTTTATSSFSNTATITTRLSDSVRTSMTVKRSNSDDGTGKQSTDRTTNDGPELSGKRIKLETTARRKHVLDFFQAAYRRRRDQYVDHVLELFFLEQQGNLMDFYGWRKRAPTLPMLHYLRNVVQDDANEFEQLQLDKARLDSIGPSGVKIIPLAQLGQPLPSVPQTPGTGAGNQPLFATAAGNLSSSSTPTTVAGSSFAGTTATTFTPLSSSSTASSTGTTPAGAIDGSSFSAIGAGIDVSSGGGSETTTPSAQRISQLTNPSTTSTSSVVQTLTTTLRTNSIDKNVHHHHHHHHVTTPLRPPSGLPSHRSNITVNHHHIPSSTTGHHHRPSSSTPSRTSTHRNVHTSASTTLHVPGSVRGTPHHHHATVRTSIASAFDSAIVNDEQRVECAKQETNVVQRVAKLRKEGLWSCKRLPKVQEPPRVKAHWDYLLEEMEWMSTDFAQERKWKKAAAKKCARMIMRYHMDKQQQVEKQEREEQQRIRKIASNIAKGIRNFWNNVEKLVEFKMQTKLEEKRKKALDLHLNFIVDQTEKFSSWLTEGLNKSEANTAQNSVDNSPMLCGSEMNDNEFEPEMHGETDDEETIAKEEAEVGLVSDHNELDLLRKESHMPIEELITSLSADALLDSQDLGDIVPVVSSSIVKDDDVEFQAKSDEEMEDEEDTIAEQERNENDADNQAELRALEDEADMPVEKLLEMYSGAFDGQGEEEDGEDTATESVAVTETRSDDEDTEIDDDTEEEEEEEDDDDDDDDEDVLTDEKSNSPEIGVEYLINPDSEQTSKTEKSGSGIEITDIAAGAESLQPKGNTLSAVQVTTKVPHLLKGTLREYQHIGLDWLVAMYDKKLNGILADEMGLGKTIQTIALLAHLACEKGIWGPHLIVVPTSVMLNWEMEFKKWCPGFKIITYYGNPKERKLKRQGWTKPNQFHVCITSYKLVIQDHCSFRRKKWRYLILDEAQHIKNFKSQRWQMLLNFNSWRRLLLTGTPLQNNLMELWSLMHFLMPNVFTSHRDFKDWFVNPVTGMIEGNSEFNEGLIRRLHKVLRPFLLRRIKMDVEQQMPKKYEHVINCRLSKRQRYLYEEFMGLTKTRETLESGNFLSVINVLMQLRKVCNHPNLFEGRSVSSPLQLPPLVYSTASIVTKALDREPMNDFNIDLYNLKLIDYSSKLSAFAIHRIKKFQAPARYIEEIDYIEGTSTPCPPIPKAKLHLKVTTTQRTNVQPIHLNATPSSPPPPPPLRSNSVNTRLSQQQVLASTQNNCQSPRPLLTNDLNEKSLVMNGDLLIDPMKSRPTPSILQIVCNDAKQGSKLVESSKQTLNAMLATTSLVSAQSNGCDYVDYAEVQRIRARERQERLNRLSRLNSLRCSCCALYGSDLIDVTNLRHPDRLSHHSNEPTFNQGRGYFDCLFHLDEQINQRTDWQPNASLACLLKSTTQRSVELNPILERFVFVTPPASAPLIRMHAPHPCPSRRQSEKVLIDRVQSELCPSTRFLHRITTNMSTQFPELRLIQYDCGKLQTLDKLLWQLKAGGHRALIFTQMSRMLDIFEQFLNYHGHTYLRLDGTTRIEQRQALMERFNADKRIFCFILSTRSGGVGVNLTGADTVIFYDSDWNPTMDAQAQDRCHRIGQTRDVHIYRLISEKTIEENILKKARQKKFLGDLAIEGGNFTTAFFRDDSIRELFAVADKRQERPAEIVQVLSSKAEGGDTLGTEETSGEDRVRKMDLQLGQALQAAEEETDVVAAKVATAEADAEFAEFDENIPIESTDRPDEKSPEEEELDRLVYQLTPIEKYAMSFLEIIQEPIQAEQLKQAEEEIEAQKKEWELEHLKSLKEEEERVANNSETDDLLTVWNEDASQMFLYCDDMLPMPVWAPPTPPQEVNDMYIDFSSSLMYESQIIPESQLPPVHVPKEPKRARVEPPPVPLPVATPAVVTPVPVVASAQVLSTPSRSRPPKVRKEEHLIIPRSLFDRPSPSLVKIRRELKTLKSRGQLTGGPDIAQLQKIVATLGPNCTLPQPPTLQQQAALSKSPFFILHGTQQESQIPWCINEDWILLEVIQQLQELPVNLLVINPAQIPNWDLVADVLNSHTTTYRSPKLCRHHYESVILQREEGKLADLPKKTKKAVPKQPPSQANTSGQPAVVQGTTSSVSGSGSSLPTTPGTPALKSDKSLPGTIMATTPSTPVNAALPATNLPKPVRTSFLYHQDNNQSFTQLCSARFENIKQLSSKRTPTLKPIFINSTGQNPKHLSLLQENSISLEQPLTPMMVAANRAERIAREKAKSQQILEQQQIARQKQVQLAQLSKQHQQLVMSSTPIKPNVIGGTGSTGPTISVSSTSGQTVTSTNAIGAQFTKVTALPTAQLAIAKGGSVQQLIATGSTTPNQGQTPGQTNQQTTFNISANQQVSNLAKALSQAAANFQAQQNSQHTNLQIQSTGNVTRFAAAGPNTSNAAITVNTGASLPKLIAQSPVSIQSTNAVSASPGQQQQQQQKSSSAQQNTTVLSVSGMGGNNQKGVFTQIPGRLGLTHAQLQAYKHNFHERQHNQQQVTLRKHIVQQQSQAGQSPTVAQTIKIQTAGQSGQAVTVSGQQVAQITQLTPLQIQQLPAHSVSSSSVVGTPSGTTMIVSTSQPNVSVASNTIHGGRLQIGNLVQQPQSTAQTLSSAALANVVKSATSVAHGGISLASAGTGSQMVSINTSGGTQQVMTGTAGQLIQRAPVSVTTQQISVTGQSVTASPARIAATMAGSPAQIMANAKVIASSSSSPGIVGGSSNTLVPISVSQSQRIFATKINIVSSNSSSPSVQSTSATAGSNVITSVSGSSSSSTQLQATPVARTIGTSGTLTTAGGGNTVGATQTVTIPVSAVTMAGVNLPTFQINKDAQGNPGTAYIFFPPKGNNK